MKKTIKDVKFGPHINGLNMYLYARLSLNNGNVLSICKRIKGNPIFHPKDKTKYETLIIYTTPHGYQNPIYWETNKELDKYIKEIQKE